MSRSPEALFLLAQCQEREALTAARRHQSNQPFSQPRSALRGSPLAQPWTRLSTVLRLGLPRPKEVRAPSAPVSSSKPSVSR